VIAVTAAFESANRPQELVSLEGLLSKFTALRPMMAITAAPTP